MPPIRTRREPWPYDRTRYQQRNIVERLFNRLKRFRRIAARYDKLDALFLAFIHLALICDLLQLARTRPGKEHLALRMAHRV